MEYNRFKNPTTIISVIGLLGLILLQFGFNIDIEWLDATTKLICSLGVVIGVLNNPTTPGIS